MDGLIYHPCAAKAARLERERACRNVTERGRGDASAGSLFFRVPDADVNHPTRRIDRHDADEVHEGAGTLWATSAVLLVDHARLSADAHAGYRSGFAGRAFTSHYAFEQAADGACGGGSDGDDCALHARAGNFCGRPDAESS